MKISFFDNMSLFNEKLKKITLKELLVLIILLFFIHFLINTLNIIQIDYVWIYIFIIFYFIIKLRNDMSDVKGDIFSLFSKDNLKWIFAVVLLNIFLSYGILYLSDHVLNIVNNSLANSFVVGGLFATIIVSPISEELIFRGVFLNRLQLIVPPLFAVLISSLLFAALHSFGSITSAFVFAICMAILYIKTENIFVPIFAHLLNNLLAESIVSADVNQILFTDAFVMTIVSILAIISAILLSVFIFNELNSIK
jgi:hypothetical protein